MSSNSTIDLDTFFAQQLQKWRLCAEQYDKLRAAQQHTIAVDSRTYTLVYNPLRAKSTLATVRNGIVEQRPCFLCEHNRPQEQEYISLTIEDSGHNYHLAVNPYPILSHHFTIIANEHCRQTITPERLRDMEALAQQMEGYLLFFNGAQAGASAPDHFHFQTVRQADVPLLHWGSTTRERLFVQSCTAEEVKIDFNNTDMTNILCWCGEGKTQWVVVNRYRHRPQQYYVDGDEKVLISPAALEYAGIIPLVRQEDYIKMSPTILNDILRQCYDNEPLVDVGLCSHEGVTTTANSDGTTTIQGIRIGKTFHWEQTKTLTYEGEMLLRGDRTTGEKWIVNRIKAEKYVVSVICSEMAATANLNFLKAHAIITRSWLVRQLQRKHSSTARHSEETAGTIIRWYDAEGHTLFDVCGDDHCQRYQGLTAKDNLLPQQAVEETRGEILIYDGKVADTRFSKCCGGRTEEYRYCWENNNVPYLRSVPDTREDGSVFCHTQNKALLRQVLNDYDLATDDFYDWQVVYTQDELSAIIEEKQGLGMGKITALIPVERGQSGRISRLKIIGEKGEIVIGKELEIRRTLSRTHLYSSAFEVYTTPQQDGSLLFTLKGRGWGHGVGLCQIGAAVRGAEGADYKTILAAYYKGATIEKIW